jgi:Family of unknown function (DUF6390)
MSAAQIGAGERVLPPDPVGSAMFARYAFPPSRFGYCGRTDAHSLLAYAAAVQPPLGITEDVAGRARQIDAAWPYLEMIAGAAGIDDPLNVRVVEAYWLGNDLLAKIDPPAFVADLEDHFSRQLGGSWRRLPGMSDPVVAPHHTFHVFEVYPWVGLLGRHANAVALSVLDRCRIRWGQVVSLHNERAVVRSSALSWDGRALDLTTELEEQVRLSSGGGSLAAPAVEVGDWVSLHWDWVCDVLSDEQLSFLEFFTSQQLDETNRVLAARAVATG